MKSHLSRKYVKKKGSSPHKTPILLRTASSARPLSLLFIILVHSVVIAANNYCNIKMCRIPGLSIEGWAPEKNLWHNNYWLVCETPGFDGSNNSF